MSAFESFLKMFKNWMKESSNGTESEWNIQHSLCRDLHSVFGSTEQLESAQRKATKPSDMFHPTLSYFHCSCGEQSCDLVSGCFHRGCNGAWQQKHLERYNRSTLNVRFLCQRLWIKNRSFLSAVKRGKIHHGGMEITASHRQQPPSTTVHLR